MLIAPSLVRQIALSPPSAACLHPKVPSTSRLFQITSFLSRWHEIYSIRFNALLTLPLLLLLLMLLVNKFQMK